ncbi:MAG TPA: SDR family oxidoreductase [Nannocystis exedens]|nr:SDR family oxidoreductase [Nannocystis exedens]
MSTQHPLAVVTGASRGIGLAIARRLAQDHDLLLCARDPQRLQDAIRGPLSEANVVAFSAVDLSTRAGVQELLTTVQSLGRGVRVLVNNAGIAASASIARSDDDLFDRLLAINARAPFALTRALLPGMIAGGGGRVINIASTAALKGYAYTAAYSASKAAVLGWTRALAVEVATSGVTINALCPGFTDTDIASDAIATIQRTTDRNADEARTSLARFSPQRRLLAPAEIAEFVAFIASPAASAINGQALAIDGGETA